MSPRRPSATATWTAAAVAVAAAFLVVGLVVNALAPAPQGPALSSYATSPKGVAAWAELLARDGHRVTQLRGPVTPASLPAGATFVVLDDGGGLPVSQATAERVDRFVAAGGWLVISGAHASGRAVGRGRIEVVADPRYLENGALGAGDNALRSLALAGPPAREVVFDEAIHGYGPTIGLAALPSRWWVSLGLLALAGGALVLSRWVRLGGADPQAPPAPASRATYVSAMGATLARTHARGELEQLASAAAARERIFERTLSGR